MNAAIYARVSTDWQAERGYSLETQVNACRERAKELGAETIKEYVDDGYTGAYLERPALESLRDALADKFYDAVIVYDPDRLARKLAHQLLLTEEIERAGARVVFVSMDFQNTAEGRLFYQIHGSFAEYEREKIRERTMRGKRQKLRSGKAITDSHVYGYDFDKETSSYTVNAGEAGIVLRLFEMYNSGQYGGADAMTNYINAHKDEFPPPNGREWSKATVFHIIKRKMYTGSYFSNVTYHKKVGPKKEERIQRPAKEWIPMTCPRIIPDEVFEEAQQRIEHNRTYRTWHRIDFTCLLQGIAFCGNCGRGISILNNNPTKTRKAARYYACVAHAPKTKPYNCGARYMSIPIVDEIFWKTLMDACENVETFRAYVGDAASVAIPSRIRERERLKAQLDKAQGERKAVMTWFSQSLITQEEATSKLAGLKKKIEDLEHKLSDMEQQENASGQPDAQAICDIVNTCPPDIESRRAVVLAVVERVYLQRLDNNYGHKYELAIRIVFRGFDKGSSQDSAC